MAGGLGAAPHTWGFPQGVRELQVCSLLGTAHPPTPSQAAGALVQGGGGLRGQLPFQPTPRSPALWALWVGRSPASAKCGVSPQAWLAVLMSGRRWAARFRHRCAWRHLLLTVSGQMGCQ